MKNIDYEFIYSVTANTIANYCALLTMGYLHSKIFEGKLGITKHLPMPALALTSAIAMSYFAPSTSSEEQPIVAQYHPEWHRKSQ
ncbi:hypothetical protein OAT84_04030 [Gammaproteobacteria bacterium]|nr:hypothetical protein [Gammaproteobacteria bacterium]